MEKKEIFYCNLTLKNEKNNLFLKNVVYKENDGYLINKRLGILQPLKVLKVDIIHSLGFEN